MAAPDNLGVSLAARRGMNQAHTLVQRQIRSHHSHAAGVAYVYGNGVGAFMRSTLFPFHK